MHARPAPSDERNLVVKFAANHRVRDLQCHRQDGIGLLRGFHLNTQGNAEVGDMRA